MTSIATQIELLYSSSTDHCFFVLFAGDYTLGDQYSGNERSCPPQIAYGPVQLALSFLIYFILFFMNLSNMQGRSKPPFFSFFSFLFFWWFFSFLFFSFLSVERPFFIGSFFFFFFLQYLSLCLFLPPPHPPLSLSRMDLSHMDILRGLDC